MIENIIHKSTLRKILREHCEQGTKLKKFRKQHEAYIFQASLSKNIFIKAHTAITAIVVLCLTKEIRLLELKKKTLKRMIRRK